MNSPCFLSTNDGRRIAYHLHEGNGPTVVFMGGFNSNMEGAKALALDAFCRERRQAFLRFDYTGHGQSSGDFVEGAIGCWKQDALDIVQHCAGERPLLVGSSMGAWIALLVVQALKGAASGLVGIASAPDFTENLIWKQLDDEQKLQLEEKGVFYAPSCYGEEPYPITRRLIEEGRNHLLLGKCIALDIPVRLLHGTHDQDVPWQTSIKLMEQLQSSDARLTLVKGGDHRLSNPEQLSLICHTADALLPR